MLLGTEIRKVLCNTEPQLKNNNTSNNKHCVKKNLLWPAFFQGFPSFGLNTERYGASLHIQSECGENADQNNSEYGLFLPREEVSHNLGLSVLSTLKSQLYQL